MRSTDRVEASGRGAGAWHSPLASDVSCHSQSDLWCASHHTTMCWWKKPQLTDCNVQCPGVSAVWPASSGLYAFWPGAAVSNKGDGFDTWCLLHTCFRGPGNRAGRVSPSARRHNAEIQLPKGQHVNPAACCGAEGKAALFACWLWTSCVWTHPRVSITTQWKQPRNEFWTLSSANPHSSYLCQYPGSPSPAVRAPWVQVGDALWLWQR